MDAGKAHGGRWTMVVGHRLWARRTSNVPDVEVEVTNLYRLDVEALRRRDKINILLECGREVRVDNERLWCGTCTMAQWHVSSNHSRCTPAQRLALNFDVSSVPATRSETWPALLAPCPYFSSP